MTIDHKLIRDIAHAAIEWDKACVKVIEDAGGNPGKVEWGDAAKMREVYATHDALIRAVKEAAKPPPPPPPPAVFVLQECHAREVADCLEWYGELCRRQIPHGNYNAEYWDSVAKTAERVRSTFLTAKAKTT